MGPVTCPRCGTSIETARGMGGHARHCDVTREELFWAKVDKNGPNGCWQWTGTKHRYGYGACLKFLGHTRAHRISWVLVNGPIPEGKVLCHSCDNKLCVNPSHLFLGTQADNMRDAHEKWLHAYGERCPRRKLDEWQAREIASLKGTISGIALAPRYGVHPGAIHAIWRGDAWSHIHKEEAKGGTE